MELKIVDGRYVPGENSALERVSGIEELRQRILMKLTARRGEYFPMEEFGSKLHTLSRLRPSQVESEARRFVAQALAGEEGLILQELSFTPEDKGGGRLLLSFSYGGDKALAVESRI